MTVDILTDVQGEELDELAGGEHGVIAVRMSSYLFNYVEPRGLGWVCDGRTTYEMKADTPEKEPDVSFIAGERLAVMAKGKLKLAPDLAVEVISPNDKQVEVEQKALEYLNLGVRLVWVISPGIEVVYVYRAGNNKPVAVLGINDELDGENVIPGFKLPVSKLFTTSKKAVQTSQN